MVLESLFNPFVLKRKPWQMFIAGLIYAIVGLMLSFFVFREIAGILMVFLIVIAALPTIYITLRNEEELELKKIGEMGLLKEHTKMLIFLMALFFGITVALLIAYISLPEQTVSTIFSLQERAIINVNQNIQGHITGGLARLDFFIKVFMNNLKVLFFCLIFSLLYGTGAIFILTWNASVIATAMGNLIKTELAQAASSVGFTSVAAYFGATTLGFFRYMTHGIFEIAAYFVMGLAGGMLSVAIIKHNLQEEQVIIDTLDLVFISLGLLLVAALLEVYVTPVFFVR